MNPSSPMDGALGAWTARIDLRRGLLAASAGLLLFGIAAAAGKGLEAGPAASAILEETLKSALLLAFGWSGRGAVQQGNARRQARSRALGVARGLSLGLVAVAVFAGAENLTYLAVFQESGVLARLFWSLPVHLVAALAEAFGVLLLLSAKGRIAARLALWTGALVSAMAWHLAANLLVASRLPFPAFLLGGVLAYLLVVVLVSLFLRQAYLGGFLHGAD